MSTAVINADFWRLKMHEIDIWGYGVNLVNAFCARRIFLYIIDYQRHRALLNTGISMKMSISGKRKPAANNGWLTSDLSIIPEKH
jgi:hypothetical protein